MTHASDPAQLPPSLGTWLREGCDLTAIPDLENYAKVIVISHHAAPAATREKLAAHFWSCLNTWLDGNDVTTPEGEALEPTFDRIRHAMWMCEGLIDEDVAARLEAALPEPIRAMCLARAAEVAGEAWPV